MKWREERGGVKEVVERMKGKKLGVMVGRVGRKLYDGDEWLRMKK